MTPSSSWFKADNPLIIASSGGNGHISAAQSLIQQFLHFQKSLTYHTFPQASKKMSLFEQLLLGTLQCANMPILKKLAIHLHWPHPQQLKKAKIQLINQQNAHPHRFYVDFLVDWLPHGVIYAAFFNLLQSQSNGKSLKKVTKGQETLDRLYKLSISRKIYNELIKAAQQGRPYDIIISTQALGIPGLLHGITRYHQSRKELEKRFKVALPEIRLHQFVTDIPEASALHFLKPLQKLKPSEKKYLSIHLLDLKKKNIFEEQHLADEIYVYPPEQHPIIRSELRQAKKNPSFFGFNYLICQGQSIFIRPKQKLALLMLSSGQGPSSLQYIEQLVNKGIEHIAVVGKIPHSLRHTIKKLQSKSKIYMLGHLNAKELAKMLSAAHLLIIKGGGLSLMELASIKLRQDARIYIHHCKEKNQGLVWEDGNIEWFLNHCKQNHKKAFITHPEIIAQQL